MKWWQLAAVILGEAEQVVPVFIHNPKSQQVEAVVVSSANGILEGIAQLQQQKGQTPAA